MVKRTLHAAVIAAPLVASALMAGPALAQPATAPSQGGHTMPGMDMTTMMAQCTQMRQQMQAGKKMTGDMQPMMRQCDAMDRQMGAPADTAAAPRTRTR